MCSCENPTAKPSTQTTKNSFDTLILRVIALDTMAKANKAFYIEKQLNDIKSLGDYQENPYYHYFSGLTYDRANKADSARYHYNQMNTEGFGKEANILKKHELLFKDLPPSGRVVSSQMQEVLSLVQEAEQEKSKLLYKIYDMIAKCYYQNENGKKAAEYSNKSFEVHPFRNEPEVRQRFYDIAFLLAAHTNNIDEMIKQNEKARALALKIGDSLAIARTYDSDARIFAQLKQPLKSVESSKKYIEYLIRINAVNQIAYNNLATSYVRAGKFDEAIINFKKANDLMMREPLETHTPDYYGGLKESYQKKGMYRFALEAADSAREIAIRNQRQIDAKTIEEIHEKYQSEKKDQNIKILENENNLNEKLINQQRWIIFSSLLLFAGALSFFYSRYRNRLLKNKNELLEAENKRLNTERKMLQAQLNPHFIFNAVANLQSLINLGEKDLSSKYLSAFSKLLRNILEQSRKEFISVEEEVETLKNYLNLQKMRFSDLFDYEIETSESLDEESVLLPPMLIQPFVENSIEHGFRNIDYKGLLQIKIEDKDSNLFIDIIDNGRGIEETAGQRSDKNSLSRIILKERLEALFNNSDAPAQFEILQNKAQGGQGVTIKIKLPIVQD